MRILELTKVKLGDEYPIVRVKYKATFKTIERDAIKGVVRWVWADTGKYCGNDVVLNKFYESTEYSYRVNGF
jgi:hypothetical protein